MEEHRKTPQVFSAHSFYASNGTRLVADVQGVADLYTDPQVLSMDYRFGDGDLGPRGESNYCSIPRVCNKYQSTILMTSLLFARHGVILQDIQAL